MSREQLVDMARTAIGHARNGTQPLTDAVHRVPAVNYVDPERWKREMASIFNRVPLVLAFSCELAEPHAYKSLDAAGTPVLITRGADGQLRSFVNMCSHRGAIVVSEGAGTARRFTCPYHAWSYDPQGVLVGMLDRDDFGPVDTTCLGLSELPTEERAGLVFVGLSAGGSLHLDEFLHGYDELLEQFAFADCVLVGRQTVAGPNWKIAYDGYLDFYHLPILHKNSFGPDFPNKAVYTAWGPHQRIMAPDQRMVELGDIPEEKWSTRRLLGGVWTIFPHVSIAPFDAGGPLYLVSQLFPGPTPGESVTVQSFLATRRPDDEQRALIDAQMEFLLGVVRDEDYYTGLRIQQALRTGAKPDVLFGRNEGGGQRFHRWTDALIRTPDTDLPALYANGI